MTKDEALQETAQEQKTAEEQRNFFAAWESPAEMTEERQAVFRILSWQYPHGKETRLPAKLSISEIKRKYQEEMTGEIIMPASGNQTARFCGKAEAEQCRDGYGDAHLYGRSGFSEEIYEGGN